MDEEAGKAAAWNGDASANRCPPKHTLRRAHRAVCGIDVTLFPTITQAGDMTHEISDTSKKKKVNTGAEVADLWM